MPKAPKKKKKKPLPDSVRYDKKGQEYLSKGRQHQIDELDKEDGYNPKPKASPSPVLIKKLKREYMNFIKKGKTKDEM